MSIGKISFYEFQHYLLDRNNFLYTKRYIEYKDKIRLLSKLISQITYHNRFKINFKILEIKKTIGRYHKGQYPITVQSRFI